MLLRTAPWSGRLRRLVPLADRAVAARERRSPGLELATGIHINPLAAGSARPGRLAVEPSFSLLRGLDFDDPVNYDGIPRRC